MKNKIIKRFAGVMAFLMLATQITIPVYAQTTMEGNLDTGTQTTGDLDVSITDTSGDLDAGDPDTSATGNVDTGTTDTTSDPDVTGTSKVEDATDEAQTNEEEMEDFADEVEEMTGDESADETATTEPVELSTNVDADNVVDVVSGDVEGVTDEAATTLTEEAAEEVTESLEGETDSEIADALEDMAADIEAEIAAIEEEIQDNPRLKEKLIKKIRHLKELLAKIRAKLIYSHQGLAYRVIKIKNVPAVYEIRWGNLTGSRQPCRLAPLAELKEALAAGEIPEKCEVDKVDYTGKISVDKGELKVRKEVLFEDNDSVTADSGSSIAFDSVIAGHWDGLVVQYIPPEEEDEAKEAVKVTVSIGDLEETYVGNEVLGRKKIGNGHMIEFRHLGKILPGLVKANQNKLIQYKLNVQEKLNKLRKKLDRIRMMKNVGTGADELEDTLDEAGEYNFDDTTAAEVEEAVEDVASELDEDSTTTEIAAKAKLLKAKILAAKKKAKLLKFNKKLIPFKDTDDDQWYTNYVQAVKNRGIISGYKDASGNELGEFRPANNITVAEILKIGLETAGKGKASGTPGLRSALNHWAKAYVKKSEELGLDLVDGDVDLNRPATRAEVVRLMLEALGIEPDAITSTDFSDVPRLHKHALFIQYAKELGIVSGDDNTGMFRPNDPINRAEAAKIADQIINVIFGGSDSVILPGNDTIGGDEPWE